MKRTFILILLCSNSALNAQLNTALNSVFEDNNLMGMSVVTVCGGQVQHVFHAGKKDNTRNLLVDDSTMYRIASISKMVTATGMMNLFEDGLFQLDDDINDAMGFAVRNPNYPDVPITFRMVLSHTSSLQDGDGYDDFLSGTYNFQNDVPNFSEYLLTSGDYYETNNWRTEEPGTYFTYSNANYGLVGTLIEKLSGERFDQYMKENVLEPLGIAGSFNITDIENIDNVAAIYRNQGGSWTPQADNYQGQMPSGFDLENYVPGTNGILFGPQGGLRISALDLAKILLVHSNFDPGVLDAATIALMHEPQWTYTGSNGDNYYGLFRSWGLGVHITTNASGGDILFEDDVMYGHPGEAYGLISDMYFGSQNGSGFIFVTNGCFNGYDFGDFSSFYTVEEEVFSAIYTQAVLNCTTTIKENSAIPFLSLFPNPAEDVLSIEYVSRSAPAHITICDARGVICYEQLIDECHPHQINVSNFASGFYSVIINSELKLENAWFVKH